MRTILLLMDSLNRHYLNAYQDSWIQTPNIDRLAARGLVFDNHWCGSLPCMPARRDMMTGRLNFLETPWGPVEPYDDCLPTELRRQKQVYSHLITDHYHYFHTGGNGYHDLFNSWEFLRGQEGDVWHPLVDTPAAPPGTRGKSTQRGAYWANREFLDAEDELAYSTPQSFARAIDFLDYNHQADKWHLHLEVFDPHEPFDCPSKYLQLYGDTWDKYLYNWPAYAPLDPVADDKDAVQHIRRRYAGALTMADAWLGRFLDAMDKYKLWDDTLLILTTDHGHLLGEHGFWAKNYMFDYAELAHIPLIVCAPGVEPGRRQALTTTIDLMPTLMEAFGAKLPPHVRGSSILHLLPQDEPHHDAVLYGYFGKDVNMTDGRYTYTRIPEVGSTVYHHTATPGGFRGLKRDELAKAELGPFLSTAHQIPVYRVPKASSRHHGSTGEHLIYDLEKDPGQASPVQDRDLEQRLAEQMARLLQRYDAPASQYPRIGLPVPPGH